MASIDSGALAQGAQPSEALMGTYPYLPLDPSCREFRLLRLDVSQLTGNPPYPLESISGSLYNVSLDSNTLYEALSYVWGSPKDPKQIRVDGITVSIGSNVAYTLQYIAKEHPLLWIDALCINQRDDEEKGLQVQMMEQLYNSAVRVIVWLGPPNERRNTLFDTLHEYIRQPQMSEISVLDFIDPAEMNHFLAHPYWTRVWVIQEMALAKDGVCLSGTKEATFYEMFSACHAMDRAFGTDILLNSNRPLLHALNVIGVRDDYQKEPKPLVTTLMKIHNTPRPVNATDARDRIYGVLALASDTEKLGIVPDYTRSAKEAYIDTARRLIYGGFPDILYFEKSIPGGQPGLQELLAREVRSPSWVPDWGNDTWDAGLGEPFFASGSTTVRGHSSGDDGLLGLDGILVDEVKYVDPKSSTFNIPWVSEERMQERLEVIADLCRRSKLYSDEERYKAQWRVPIIDWEQSDDTGQGQRATDVSRLSYEKCFGRVSNFDLEHLSHADGASYSYIAHRRSCNRPFLSNKGYVGIGQLCVQPKDLICIFLGANMPVIIRPVENGTYLMIGSAFIHGLMDGEILNQNPKIEPVWLS